ncbi:OmpP1/FadL family transporter [Acidithiobacillus sp.]|uniref:OmpP1/FadL family transporter n=1 Tax=Acidithiobacillus sp. TaxID=1872118 RepID=UPI0031FF33EB
MKKSRILGIAVGATLAMGLSASALATDGYQLIGIGQYAIGMAGAVVAAPDDPLSAAMSNPAGLALLTPQAAFSAEIFNPTRKTNFGFGEIGSHSNVYGVPAIGWVAPAFGDGIVFGGGVYGTSGLGVNYIQPGVNGPAYDMRGNPPSQGFAPGTINAYSSITFMQMAPSLAMKVNSHLAIGASLNISAEQGSFVQSFTPNNNAFFAGQSNAYYVGGGLNLAAPSWAYGVGVTLGALYKVNDMVTLGATYKSPVIFTPMTWQESGEVGPGNVQGGAGQYSGHLNYPQQIALGLAIRPIPQWLISVEGQWINWHATMNNFTIYGPWQGASSVALPMHWTNQWVANIGTQYDLTNWLQVRAGYTYGSNPISNADTASNLIFPAVVQNAITFGATQKLGMGWKLTEAYMHAFANTITGPAGSSPFYGNQAPSATLAENSYGLQVGYDF